MDGTDDKLQQLCEAAHAICEEYSHRYDARIESPLEEWRGHTDIYFTGDKYIFEVNPLSNSMIHLDENEVQSFLDWAEALGL